MFPGTGDIAAMIVDVLLGCRVENNHVKAIVYCEIIRVRTVRGLIAIS